MSSNLLSSLLLVSLFRNCLCQNQPSRPNSYQHQNTVRPASTGLDSSSLLLQLLLGSALSGNKGGLSDLFNFDNLFPAPTPAPAPTPTVKIPTPAELALGALFNLGKDKTGFTARDFQANRPDEMKYNNILYKFQKENAKDKDWSVLLYKAPEKQPQGSNYLYFSYKPNKDSGSVGGYEYKAAFGSPLAFDLDGDGATKLTADKELFDVNNDGVKDSINKLNAKDGLLVMDANGNGILGENATEVFGGNTLGQKFDNGFEALKAVAEKFLGAAAVADGKLDASEIKALEDKVSLQMKVNGETKSLSSLGVSDIQLGFSHDNIEADSFGNIMGETSTFKLNGKDAKVVDIWFQHN